MEIWVPIPKLKNKYEVSQHGRVRNVYTKHVLKPELNQKGYPRLTFRKSVVGRHNLKIHHLVAEAFLGPRPEGTEVNHIDLDKTNNRPSNLEYVTGEQNRVHFWQHRKASHKPNTAL